MQPNSDVMFIVTYDSGHEEWFSDRRPGNAGQ